MSRNTIDIKKDRWYVSLDGVEQKSARTLAKELKPGEHLSVDRVGALKIKKSHRFFHKLNIIGRRREEKAVKEAISGVVRKITANDRFTSAERKHLKELFFKRLAMLETKVFDRSQINQAFTPILRRRLIETSVRLEDPKAEKLRKLDRRVEKVKLAMKLGVDLKPIAAGNSGSYFARDYKGKIKAVFKPGEEDSLGAKSPKLKAKLFGFFQRHVLKIDTAKPFWALEGHYAEAMSSKVAEHLGFVRIAPASKVVRLKSTQFVRAKKAKSAKHEKGSFQVFVGKTESLDKKLKLQSMGVLGGLMLKLRMKRYQGEVQPPIKPHQFEQLAVLDFLICNRDRHFENILMDEKENIYVIDHGLSMPKQNPDRSDILYKRNQYKWEHFPQSRFKFSSKMIDRLKELLQEDNLEELVQSLTMVKGENPEHPFDEEFEGSSQESAFRDRVQALLKAIDEGYSIHQLAQLRSKEDIEEFLATE